jgi:exopolysaccharide biosynthesis polyprenyl glycosylphosphotransferase
MRSKRPFSRTQTTLLLVQLAGDLIVSFAGLSLGYWLRFHSALQHIGLENPYARYGTYVSLLALGALFLIGSYVFLRLYSPRLLLRPHRSALIIVRATFFWFLIFFSISFILKFEPSVSRIFAATACGTTLVAMFVWRYAFFHLLKRSRWRERIIQRVVVIGWSDEAARLARAILHDNNHPYQVYGIVTTGEGEPGGTNGERILGPLAELNSIVERDSIDIVVVADLSLPKERLLEIVSACERHYIAFKIIPSVFQIFVSNLRMDTISGVPLMGVEALAIWDVTNQLCKRLFDVAGASIGLALSAPVMLVMAFLIKHESPGPVVFRQVRTGRHGRPFVIYKLRSMNLDAEKDTGARWAVPSDPRRLKIGAFMRRWNLDELPQFWNVLIGDMSLVGPRPERPELIAKFEKDIPHYNPRHEMRPGMTGWAQVNGLRGNTSLTERIRYDLYYVENWSLWFDLHILLVTLFRWQNAY